MFSADLKYKSATDKLSLTNAVEQIKSKENYVKLEDISQDYKNAGEMKDIFLKIVNEDQENELNLVKAKTLLICLCEL